MEGVLYCPVETCQWPALFTTQRPGPASKANCGRQDGAEQGTATIGANLTMAAATWADFHDRSASPGLLHAYEAPSCLFWPSYPLDDETGLLGTWHTCCTSRPLCKAIRACVEQSTSSVSVLVSCVESHAVPGASSAVNIRSWRHSDSPDQLLQHGPVEDAVDDASGLCTACSHCARWNRLAKGDMCTV